MDKYCLYIHINKFNDKVYIGITKNIQNRWSGKGSHYKRSTAFYNAIKKYGWDNFIHVVLIEGLSKEEACSKEKMWIKFYKTEPNKCYNIADGGDGVNGKSYPEKRHKVYQFDLYGNILNVFDGIENAASSVCNNNESIKSICENICRCCNNKKGSFRNYIWGYCNNIKNLTNRKTPLNIGQFTMDGKLIKIWSNYSEIKKETNFKNNNIANCVSGKRNSAYGYKWRKINNYEIS